MKGSIGAITAMGEKSFTVAAQGGEIEVFRDRHEGGKKLSAAELCGQVQLSLGTVLGG